MPLDPQAKQLLDAMAAMAMPPIGELEPTQLRQMLTFPTGAKVDSVGDVNNLWIDGPYRKVPARLYRPNGEGPFAVVVLFHGGGFVVGDLDSYDPLCRKICNIANVIVVSVDYALAPEAKFPKAPYECYAVTSWVAEHIGQYKGRPDKIAVMGDSAGGCLAAVVCQMARQKEGPAITHQVLIYPVTDCSFETNSYRENAEGYFLTRELMQWFWNHYLNDPEEALDPLASPLRAKDLSGLPAATIITAGFDPLRDEGIAYNKRLQDAGVVTEAYQYEQMFHGFLSFSEGIDVAEGAVQYIGKRLRACFS